MARDYSLDLHKRVLRYYDGAAFNHLLIIGDSFSLMLPHGHCHVALVVLRHDRLTTSKECYNYYKNTGYENIKNQNKIKTKSSNANRRF